MPPFSRAQFFRMHILKCATCRKEWLELKKTIPASRENKLVEEVVRANHHNTKVIA